MHTTGGGISPSEEMMHYLSTTSEITTNKTPSGEFTVCSLREQDFKADVNGSESTLEPCDT